MLISSMIAILLLQRQSPRPALHEFKLPSGTFAIKVAGHLSPSKYPDAHHQNALYKSGAAFYGGFGSLGIYVMEGVLSQTRGITAKSAASDMVEGYFKKHSLKGKVIKVFYSPIREKGIQVLSSFDSAGTKWAMVVHVVMVDKRLFGLRLLWPSKSKEATLLAYDISNSVRLLIQ